MKFLYPIDLAGLEILNVRAQNLGTAPTSPSEGTFYYDSANHTLTVWNGTSWINTDAAKVASGSIPLAKLATDPLARANHTGVQLAATISDFNSAVQSNSLSSLSVAVADVSLNNHKITNLTDPTSAQDAATKAYVDATVQSAAAGIDSKPSVRAVAVANITRSGTQTIDGVSLIAGNRVLLTGQTDATQNGPYLVAAGAWSRPADADENSELTPGAFWFAEEGTTYGASQWRISNTGNIVVGSTNISITQFGATVSYTAGDGLALTGTAFSVKLPASSGLIVDSSGVYVDRTAFPTKYAVSIGDGASTSFTVTHNLNTQDVIVMVRKVASTYDVVQPDIQITSVNTITLLFSVAPTSNQYRVIVIG